MPQSGDGLIVLDDVEELRHYGRMLALAMENPDVCSLLGGEGWAATLPEWSVVRQWSQDMTQSLGHHQH